MRRVTSFSVRILQVLVAFFLATVSSFAASVTLAWDPNTEPDLAGYRVYYGTTSGTYTESVDAGNETAIAIPNLLEGTTYYFAVTAYNTAAFESAWSNEITFTPASSQNTPPSVTLTAPANGATYLSPANISLNASASDADGSITKVEFYNGSTKLGEDTTSPYTYSLIGLPAGSYTFSARAIDNLGAQTTSTSASIVVSNPNQSPTIAITSPTSGTQYTSPASLTIDATAADSDGSVVLVEFYSGSTKLGEDTSSPFAFSWSGVAPGNYSLKAVAIDDLGFAATSATVSVTVRAPNLPPTVAMTTPVDGAIVTGPATNFTMMASASDSDGTISKVEFYWGSTKLGEDLSSPYSFTWPNLPSGNYPLSAVATDNSGATATSAVVNLTVNALPSVSLTTNGISFTAPASVNFTATAADTDGTIAKVEFYNGATKLGEKTASPFTFAWNNVSAGSYAVSAIAVDNRGGFTASAPVSISVAASNQVPTVAITNPINTANFNTPASVAITANASDADGTITKVEFFRGSIKLGEDLSSPYSFTWANAAAGNYLLTAVATDNSGASATSTAVNISVNASPSVVLTTNGTSFPAPASITLTAAPTDSDGTISKVEFFNGPTKLGEQTASPYTFAWSNVAVGTHSLTARATDDRGAVTASSTVNVTVTAANQPPTVAISTSSGSVPVSSTPYVAPANITLYATASDPDGTIARVDFYQGTTKLGQDTSSPYAYTWSNVAAGTYAITAVAFDNAGATATSAPLNITVQAGRNVVLTTNGTTFNPGAAITMSASTAQLSGRVRRVDFYRDSVLLYKDTKSPYSFAWKSVPAGTYSLKAVAIMNSGAIYTSTPIRVTVGTAQPSAMMAMTSSYEDPMPTVVPYFQPDGTLNLGITGQSGQTYKVWASTDLKEWTLMTTVANENGFISVTDPDAPAHKQRFYRVSVQE